MDFLFVRLIQHFREKGFASFNLGMAPLSGFAPRPLSSRWHKIGHLVFRHGEHFYNFQGLRAFKEKFNPIWEPHYLAYPGGLMLPRILADVSALVAGGYRRIFLK